MVSRRTHVYWLACVLAWPWSGSGSSAAERDQCSEQITYRSDSDDGYKYLEAQQRQIYQGNPNITDPFSREELKSPRSVRTWQELKARALEACPDQNKRNTCALDPDVVGRLMSQLPCLVMPTRFESPLFSSLINLYTSELDKVRLQRFPTSAETRFGSLPTGIFDAQAVLPKGMNIPVVILNRDIFSFTGALSKAISDAIPISRGASVQLEYSDDSINQRLRTHRYIVDNFADAMVRMARDGSSFGAIEITLDEDHNHLHARLVSAMDTFLIAHEQSHVILNHISDKDVDFRLAGGARASKQASETKTIQYYKSANRNPAAPADISPVLKAQLRTREQELQADALGLKLMIWSLKKRDDPIGVMIGAAAPHLIFRILDAVNAYGGEAGGWTYADANHPAAEDRIAALAPVYERMSQDVDELRQVDFRIPFDAALKSLLAAADPQIRQKLGIPQTQNPIK